VLILRGENDMVVKSWYNIAQKDFYNIYNANVNYIVKPWAHMQAIVEEDTTNFPKIKCDDSSSTGYLNCEEEFDTAGEIFKHLLPNIYSTWTAETGSCVRTDDSEVVEESTWKLTIDGADEEKCKDECRKDTNCTAYQFDSDTCMNFMGEVTGAGGLSGREC
jgi:hypothetical protein